MSMILVEKTTLRTIRHVAANRESRDDILCHNLASVKGSINPIFTGKDHYPATAIQHHDWFYGHREKYTNYSKEM